MNNVTFSLISTIGMVLVACVSIIYWRYVSKLRFKWFWTGAGLWFIAVILKLLCALLTNTAVIGFFNENLSYPLYVISGGLFTGIQSSLFEIGFTLLAVLIWQQLGNNANRAIGIGVGAGAFEALLLSVASLVGIITYLAGLPGAEKVRVGIDTIAAATPLFWLVAPVERLIAILCHASSRALVLLGVTARKPMMVIAGFIIFALLDSVAGAAQISGKLGQISMWWIELCILPFALISIPILRWCYVNWNRAGLNQIISK